MVGESCGKCWAFRSGIGTPAGKLRTDVICDNPSGAQYRSVSSVRHPKIGAQKTAVCEFHKRLFRFVFSTL